MGSIYGLAHTTIAWLGVPQLKDEPYYEMIFDCVSQQPYRCYGDSVSNLIIPPFMMLKHEEIGHPENETCFHAKRCIEQLLVNPWFYRVWTLQEFIIGSLRSKSCVLCYGRFSVNMKLFVAQCSHPSLDNACPVTLTHSDYLHAFTRMHALEPLTDWATKRGMEFGRPGPATNDIPHDTIYGVLGLWQYVRRREFPQELTPDYHLSYAQVCCQYSAYLLGLTRDLRIIAKRRVDFQTTVPSWVPDMRYINLRWGQQTFQTDRTEVEVSANGQDLLLTGRRFASVVDGIASSSQLQKLYTPASWKFFTQRIAEFEDKI
ncbi:hypothetical protein BO78DRAFT_432913 [Aspergillus sclerotiicarbonarius CBS 121057]|uniref:Heterokaryon incompatibility domain-containing protein n=1 Tax=Aspergillus sclerotiicarbonarius (strain CBS 121057 / IBT 28362) TaxID=1448318 RepID=A0A319DYU6_ASPSB|nr:hypothetical protein BO78DRAFT_432913 [Aspergillus sclerotiicarbonarius CBS 121057]